MSYGNPNQISPGYIPGVGNSWPTPPGALSYLSRQYGPGGQLVSLGQAFGGSVGGSQPSYQPPPATAPATATAPAPTPTQQANGNQNAPPRQAATPKAASPGANYGYPPQAPQAGAAQVAPVATAAPVAPMLQASGFPQAAQAPAPVSPLERTAPINPLHAAIMRQAAPLGMQTGVFGQDPRLSFRGINP